MKHKSLLGSFALALALSSAALTTRLHGTSAPDSDEASIAKVTARLLEARKKERASRPAPHETRYEITLKNAAQPGLPEPLSAAAHSAVADKLDGEADVPDQAAAGKDFASDCILEETQHILLDYIRLLNAPANPAPAGTPALPVLSRGISPLERPAT